MKNYYLDSRKTTYVSLQLLLFRLNFNVKYNYKDDLL